jgi:phage terminase large subunit
MKFVFNRSMFNDLFWHLEKDFNDPKIRFIFAYGGSSASKTYTCTQLEVIRKLTIRENTMILRKYGVDIKDSIYTDFLNVIESFGLQKYFKCQINYIECTLTGAYIRFRGLDDSEKIKGLAGFKRVWLEEVSQFEETDLKQIRKRLRGSEGQQIVCLFNPIDENHWLKVKLFDTYGLIDQPVTTNITSHARNEKGNFVVYKVTYLNNYFIVGKWKNGKQIGGFIDQHTIDDFEKDKVDDYAYYQIYALGNWGKIRTGGEFWKDFNTNIHVGKAPFDPAQPIHLSWDENLLPYITCEVWQIQKGKPRQIDEILLPDPQNRVPHVCRVFRERYPASNVHGLIITGDRTSLKDNTTKEKGQNFFTEIMAELAAYRPVLKLPSTNPSVADSGDFVNAIYRGVVPRLDILIDEKCIKSIHDYQYTLEDNNRGVLKKMVKNKVTGQSYQEFGHCTDAKRYFLTMSFNTEYNTFIRRHEVNRPLTAPQRIRSNSF